MRNEDVVEDHDADGLTVFRGEFGRGLPGPPRGTRHDGDAGRVAWNGAADREVLVPRSMRTARHHQKFMHVRRAGDDGLGAANDDAVLAPFLDVDVDVAIDLLARAFGAVALGVSHGDAKGQVALLDFVQIAQEALTVIAAMAIIGSAGRLKNSVEGVVGQVALRASGGLANQAHGFKLVEQVRRILIDMEHAIDGLA